MTGNGTKAIAEGPPAEVTAKTTTTITAERFELRDKEGKLRFELGASPGKPTEMTLYDEKGVASLELGAHSAGSGLIVKGKDDKNRAVILFRPRTGPEISLAHESGKPAISMQVVDGVSIIGLAERDGKGKPRIELYVGQNGIPGLRLLDGDHNVRAIMDLGVDGRPEIGIMDTNQIGRVGMGLGPNGAPEFSLKDSKGRLRCVMSMGENGSTSIGVIDEFGNTLWRSPQ
jgi:hypothetical protein